jgi:molecular chaperone GrpE
MEDRDRKEEKKEKKAAGREEAVGGGKDAGAAAEAEAPGAASSVPHGGADGDKDGETKELREKLQAAEAASREYLGDLQRLKAEFDNYRKRMIREQTSLIESANQELVGKLLPVIDNLERALASAGEGASEGLAEGVRMVLSQLSDILKQEGLEVIDPKGHPFDPKECEAVNAVVSDDHEDETVVEVHQKGYRFKGRLLRPAMATVSRCRDKAEGPGGNG